MRWQLVLLALSGCGDGSGIESEHVARIVGSTLVTADGGGTLGAVADSLLLASGEMPAGFSYENGIATGLHGSLEHRYMMLECRDRDDQRLPSCSSDTDHAVAYAGWSGEVRLGDLVVQTSRQGMWSFTNLQYWTPIVSGASEVVSQATIDDASYVVTAQETAGMITPRHMMGGTIDLELAVTRGDSPVTMTASITFDAIMTSAALVVDGDEFRIDLATGMLE